MTTETAAATKLVYDFAEGSRDMRDLLGGKGANVAEMTRVLGEDRVPAGFTITTEACVAYMKGGHEFPDGLTEQVAEALERLEEQAERKLGDEREPAAGVRAQSGARESMPGMLDTVLNLGLNDESVEGLAQTTGNERFAWDSYRRFCQMFGNVCRGIPGERFEDLIEERKSEAGVEDDVDLDVDDLQGADRELQDLFGEETGDEFPEEPQEQLKPGHRRRLRLVDRRPRRALSAHQPDPRRVGHGGQRAADGVRQQGDSSCSGVAFSRDEITGESTPSGDFLPNAQGEDVVSGVRTPHDLHDMKDSMPETHEELMEILRTLEGHYEDMQDTEFTVEEGSALHAPDPQRQAARAGGHPLRGGRRGGGPARQRRSDLPPSTPAGSTRCCTAPSPGTPTSRC